MILSGINKANGIIKINATIKLPEVLDKGLFCPRPKREYSPHPSEAINIKSIPTKLFPPILGSTNINKPTIAKNIPKNRTILTFSFKTKAPTNITNCTPPNKIKAPTPVSITK